MYKVIENPDGTATVKSKFSGRRVRDFASRMEAETWIAEQHLRDEADDLADAKGMNTTCEFCGQPTRSGRCPECQ